MDEKRKIGQDQKKMFKLVKTLNFRGTEDAELLGCVNEYAKQLKGINPKAAIRNLLLRILPVETQKLRANSGDFAGRQSA